MDGLITIFVITVFPTRNAAREIIGQIRRGDGRCRQDRIARSRKICGLRRDNAAVAGLTHGLAHDLGRRGSGATTTNCKRCRPPCGASFAKSTT